MKVCPKCGAAQNNSRTVCIDCGALLDKPLNEKQSDQIEGDISDKIDKLTERTDDFRIGILNIILIAVNAAVIISMITVMLIRQDELTIMLGFWISVIAAVGIVTCAAPKLNWEITKLTNQWRYYNAENLAPSQSYIIFFRIGMILITVISLVPAICVLVGDYELLTDIFNAFSRTKWR